VAVKKSINTFTFTSSEEISRRGQEIEGGTEKERDIHGVIYETRYHAQIHKAPGTQCAP
jgi:hypothetical protein